ncbi:AAA family ATPase [Novosphingobium sp.]|uniref:AAA family ATPase n=1 Tax=Novosphingobium sp. TaxID=1874826 RepID=UPI0025D125C6|nr:AAA family ATPase [Novosphingobium sp.]
MTKHSKIPVPGTADEGTSAANAAKDTGTLIERVVRNFDLVQLNSPAIPENLIPPAAKRRRYRRAGDRVEEAVVSPVEPEVAPRAERRSPTAFSEPRPEVVEPEVISPMGSPAPTALAKMAEPVRFNGEQHAISREHLREQGLIVPEGTVTGLLEEFRIVKRQLLLQASQLAQQGMGAEAQRVLVCSPHSGEGKTYTSVNLALAIAAEKETEVLLVDADFAKPSVLSSLGLPGGPGLMDALAKPELDVVDCVVGTDIPGLWVLPAGNATTSDSEYLSSSRTRHVLDRLTQGSPHRFVIFDSPPALAASPAAELAKYVGQAVLVARADRTGQGALEDAIDLLSACPNIQLLLNAVHFSPSGRRFGSYYGYGG